MIVCQYKSINRLTEFRVVGGGLCFIGETCFHSQAMKDARLNTHKY